MSRDAAAGTMLGRDPELLASALSAAAMTLARRFSAGATMWCVAPSQESHGLHVAVEFVHPVIVGKRALPAVHLAGGAALAELRLLAEPGDVVVVIGPGDAPETIELLRRAEAWGLTRLWIGSGEPPARGLAEHALSALGDVTTARWAGEVVLVYHLLWELTHVCFEHPGLLRVAEVGGDTCLTCGDRAVVGEVQGLLPDGRAAVLAGGQAEEVDVSLLGRTAPGDLVLVHAGVALSRLDAPAAAE